MRDLAAVGRSLNQVFFDQMPGQWYDFPMQTYLRFLSKFLSPHPPNRCFLCMFASTGECLMKSESVRNCQWAAERHEHSPQFHEKVMPPSSFLPDKC